MKTQVKPGQVWVERAASVEGGVSCLQHREVEVLRTYEGRVQKRVEARVTVPCIIEDVWGHPRTGRPAGFKMDVTLASFRRRFWLKEVLP